MCVCVGGGGGVFQQMNEIRLFWISLKQNKVCVSRFLVFLFLLKRAFLLKFLVLKPKHLLSFL